MVVNTQEWWDEMMRQMDYLNNNFLVRKSRLTIGYLRLLWMCVAYMKIQPSIATQVSGILYARLKNGTYYGNTCGGRVCSLSQRVLIRYLSNLVNMLVDIISRPSSITSQTPMHSWVMAPKLSKIRVSAL